MSDTTETTTEETEAISALTETPPDVEAGQTAAGPEDSSDAPEEDADRTPSRREARYRIQLRETEAERDRLAATVEALQRAEVERLASKVIKAPTALWAAQTALADLLADDGTVDPAKVANAVTAAQKTLGLAATRPAGHVPREGTNLHQSSSSGNAWQDAFKNK